MHADALATLASKPDIPDETVDAKVMMSKIVVFYQ